MKSEDWNKLRKEMNNDDEGEILYSSVPYHEVERPAHYNRKGIEALSAIEASMSQAEFIGYLKGNIMKYLWRYGYKNSPKKDLGKARFYLDYLYNIVADTDEEQLTSMLKDLK